MLEIPNTEYGPDYLAQYMQNQDSQRIAKIVIKSDDLGVQVVIFAHTEAIAQLAYEQVIAYEDKVRYDANNVEVTDELATPVYFVTPESKFHEIYFGMLIATTCENCFDELNTSVI